ncbi:hypothetical protein SNE40_010117 [Patella caerulea]|uniref:Uncharacterized protein n=2 Tax=Patella TaxID=6463 RepID=A0AAN8JX40_PATCE
MTGSDISFDEFIKSLITATDDRPMMGPLRNDLLRMIGRYRDCAVACEHQFSKRGGTEQHLGSRLSLLCEMVTRNGISTLSETVKDYCRPYSDFSDTSF